MPSNALTLSTGRLDSSSGGASRIVFTKRWGPILFQILETTDAQPRLMLLMHHDVHGGHIDHTVDFHLQGTSGLMEIPDTLKGRLACHILLTKLPDEGIPEAAEALGQMYQFYRLPGRRTPALPAPERIQAQYGDTFVAPVYPVSEE
jgi:hypothetical protein